MRFKNLAVAIFSTLAFVVGCDKTTAPPDRLVSWFQVYLYENDQYVECVAEGHQAVPGEWVKLDLPNHAKDAAFRVSNIDRKSVEFEIQWDGVKKIARTNSQHSGEVVFEEKDSVLKFAVDAGGTVAPFGADDPPLKGELTVLRIQSRIKSERGENQIRGREIVETQSLDSPQAISSLNEIMSNPNELNLGSGADCFDPHHAIRVKNSQETIEIIVCFECWAIRVFRGDPQGERHSNYDEYCLRDDSRLKSFFAEHFPGDPRLTSRE